MASARRRACHARRSPLPPPARSMGCSPHSQRTPFRALWQLERQCGCLDALTGGMAVAKAAVFAAVATVAGASALIEFEHDRADQFKVPSECGGFRRVAGACPGQEMRPALTRMVLAAVLVTGACVAATSEGRRLLRRGTAAPAEPAAVLALGATLAVRRPPRGAPAQHAAVFSNLGCRLAAVRTPKEAGQIILEAADALWAWDTFVLDLCSTDLASATPVLCVDTVCGRRTEFAPDPVSAHFSALARRALEQGPQLILRSAPASFPPEVFPVGDKARPSASLMFVPIRKDAQAIGLLSLQSYAPNAYDETDLGTLQALADHCGGALERLRAEVALHESNERLRMGLAAARMGTWTCELDGRGRMFWSPELEAIFGLGPGEFPGTEQALYDFIHPEDREVVRQAFEKAIQIRTDYETEFRFLPRGRPPGWMLGRGRAYYDAAGNPVRLAGVAIDITARKAAEQEVRRLNAELERRVRERTAQLESINQELEAFAYSVSHDLRAPLRAIRGFGEVLLERYAGRLDAEGQDFLRRACDSGQRMNRLIDDLLMLSRVGRSDLRWQRVDLSVLAEAIAAELRKAEPGREVQTVIEPGLRAEGDERLLRVVLDNLLANAWKFTRHRAGAQIRFGFSDQPEPAFFVRDNGVGFDMAYAGRLFGVFQRLHSNSEYPGTGVGLATVRRLVQRHRGRAWATGVVNQGATFYFTLPDSRDFEL